MAFDIAAIEEAASASPQLVEYPNPVPGLVLHVDGDYLAYYASGNDETSEGQARQNAIDLIHKFKGRTGATSVVMHNTANGSQKGERYLIATIKPYQGQRDSGRKPKNHGYLQNWLQTYDGPLFRAKNWLTREADDGIGAVAHHAIGTDVGYCVIATADKDMRMLPGLHISWKPVNGQHVLTRVKPGGYDIVGEDLKQYGLKFFWQQMLMGDTADHIPGLEFYRGDWDEKKQAFKIKKMGEKTAEKMLEDCFDNEQAYARVAELYMNAYTQYDAAGNPTNPNEWADRFVEQAALLWMRLDNTASVADFARHAGHSKISTNFHDATWAAVGRLEKRVRDRRAEIDSFRSN